MTDQWPTISVVTPSFNQGAYIERTLQSVISQDYPRVQHIVIDGGSTDETVEILERYAEHLDYWVSEPDAGQTDAVNKGLQRASGDIIGWLNSDDIYYPNAFRSVAACFLQHPEVNVIYGKAHHIDQDDRVINSYYTEKWDYQRLQKLCFICQPALFFRRQILEQYGLLDASLDYCMDYEYWLRCGRDQPFHYLEVPLAGSRLYPETKTLGSRLEVLQEHLQMLSGKFDRIDSQWIASYAIEKARRTFGNGRGVLSGLVGSAYAVMLWQKNQWKYNRTVLPIVPNVFLVNSPFVPARLRSFLAKEQSES